MNLHHIFQPFRYLRLLVPGFMLVSLPLFAQLDTSKTTSDELFALARNKAFEGKREEARVLCRILLERNPMNADARVLLGRTLAWDERRDEARKEFRIVLEQTPGAKDALDALLDVELWDEQYEEAVQVADRSLRLYPNEEAFLFKKARALKSLERHEEALHALLQLEDLNPSHAESRLLREELSQFALQNEIGLQYAADRFSDVFGPMHLGAIQFSRRSRLGPMFARVNLADRFGTWGYQTEVDWYPRIANGWYGYLSYGYSGSSLFPQHRFGAEAYTKLPGSLEASLGLRYLAFEGGGNVTIYTGSLGYYFRNYWISIKPYITPRDGGASLSMTTTFRWYMLDAENYISARIGVGYSADERLVQSNTGFPGIEVFYLKSRSAGLGGQARLSPSLLLTVTADVGEQELSARPDEYVTMVSFSMGTKYRF